MAEPDADDVVAVGERVGLDDDGVADHAFRREPAGVHLGADRLDDARRRPSRGRLTTGSEERA